MPSLDDNSLREVLEHLVHGAGPGEVEVLARGDDALVARVGDAVVKVHASGTGEAALEAQLRAAARLEAVLLAPVTTLVERRHALESATRSSQEG